MQALQDSEDRSANPSRLVSTPLLFLFVLAASSPATGQELVPLEVNLDRLVEKGVAGEVAPPILGDPPYRISPEGQIYATPATGGITYNFRVGDTAVHMAGDHVEPAVSVYNLGHEGSRNSPENRALNMLSCIGNTVRVLDGDAAGAEGTVIGKHGGVEHLQVEFPDEVYETLAIGDKLQVRAVGMGMEALNADGIQIANMSPRLLEAMTRHGMGLDGEGRLVVPVTHRIPAKIMGSGLGQRHVYSGDYDIQLFDQEVVGRYGLDTLRYGDIVAIIDADHAYGRIFRTGAVTIGVVAHGISRIAGHGPGVTTLLTSPGGNIEPVIDPEMNLTRLLGLRQP